MIKSLQHADNLVRHIASQMAYREVVETKDGTGRRAPHTWAPTADPREICRRWSLLVALGSDVLHRTDSGRYGNELYQLLAQYIDQLARELEEATP